MRSPVLTNSYVRYKKFSKFAIPVCFLVLFKNNEYVIIRVSYILIDTVNEKLSIKKTHIKQKITEMEFSEHNQPQNEKVGS